MARELLSDNASDSSDSDIGGADVGPDFKVNQKFAERFEFNKKREERAKLEEKLASSKKRKRGQDQHVSLSDSESSSSSEDEDDAAELATEALDSEILATLNAIRSKDPRVYDGETTFYTEIAEPAGNSLPAKDKKEKPMYLKDYHRQNLLNGGDTEKEEEPLSYNQQQENLKKSIVSEMHAAADSSNDDSGSEGDLLVRKTKKEPTTKKAVVKVNVDNADRDPETFLSNFMAARAWVPLEKDERHPFESDDESDDNRAEKFEEAYNMRFEAPEKSNEVLRSYSREYAEKYSARREENNARKKKRDAEKAAKDAAKQQLKEEKSRLKKLRLEEVQDKVKRIKKAAGLKTSDLQPEDWAHFIDDEWDDSKWEEEMQNRFGDQYYAEQDELSHNEEETNDADTTSKKKRRPHKPKFDDDIDIKDIIPDFQDSADEEAAGNFSLSESDAEASTSKPKSKPKSSKQSKIDSKHEARRERRILSALIDDQVSLSLPANNKAAGFRYRETSPESFGLTTRDILLADDSALNAFAGLKKLASFREEEKKVKDRRHLGKKARLRKWRLDTFGDEEGPRVDEVAEGDAAAGGSDEEMGGVDIREGGRKKKGRRRKKVKSDGAA